MTNPYSPKVSAKTEVIVSGSIATPFKVNRKEHVSLGEDPYSMLENAASTGFTYRIMLARMTANSRGRNFTTTELSIVYLRCFTYLYHI